MSTVLNSWVEVQIWLRSAFKVEYDGHGFIGLGMKLSGGREQNIVVEDRTFAEDRRWVAVSSAIGLVEEVDLARACTWIAPLSGGIAIKDKFVYVQNFLPLPNLPEAALMQAVLSITVYSDALEEELLQRDRL